MFTDPMPSPPVPTMSTTLCGEQSTLTARSLIASASPNTSSAVSPCETGARRVVGLSCKALAGRIHCHPAGTQAWPTRCGRVAPPWPAAARGMLRLARCRNHSASPSAWPWSPRPSNPFAPPGFPAPAGRRNGTDSAPYSRRTPRDTCAAGRLTEQRSSGTRAHRKNAPSAPESAPHLSHFDGPSNHIATVQAGTRPEAPRAPPGSRNPAGWIAQRHEGAGHRCELCCKKQSSRAASLRANLFLGAVLTADTQRAGPLARVPDQPNALSRFGVKRQSADSRTSTITCRESQSK